MLTKPLQSQGLFSCQAVEISVRISCSEVQMKKKNRLALTSFVALSFFSVFFVLSCASNHAVISADLYEEREESLYIPSQSEIKWQEIEGAEWAKYFFYENKGYPVRYHCVKINLSAENLSIITFPQSEKDFTQKNGKATNYFTGLRAGKFSKKYNSIITMNTAPFGGKNGSWDMLAKLGSTRRICGVHIVEKKELASPLARYSALCFYREEKGFSGKIIKSQTKEALAGCDYAFGGFFAILTEGEKEAFSWRSNDSRSAAGLSEDGKTLYLLVVEGERWSKSHGLSYPECADIMLALGARNAMEMDGGGSSSLFINQKNMLAYPALRKNAVFLGFN